MRHETNENGMKILRSLIRKEALHIVRDRRTMVITLVMPVVLLLLFGFAISTEVNNFRTVAVVDRHNDHTRDIIERLQVNDYFNFVELVSDSEVERMLREGKTEAALYLRTDGGLTSAHIVVDASNPTSAQAAAAYLQSLTENHAETIAVTYTLYNPQMKSAYNFVPGIMGMIFILICAIMTSVSIVSEKENGTMDLLLVSPVKPTTIIIGKLVPYFALSCITVVALSLLYVILSLSVGLLVSTLVSNQVSALIVSAVLFMLPVIMLSGMIFPIDNMPAPLQWISCAIPARWYISAMRKLMIQQLEVSYVIGEFAILTGMTAALLAIAIGKFRSNT